MSTLLRSAALVLCAGVSCAHATESAKHWEFNIGAMYEIENVEGQGDDKDGLYEPSVWFNATWDAWTLSLAMYQEGPVDYSSMTRGPQHLSGDPDNSLTFPEDLILSADCPQGLT